MEETKKENEDTLLRHTRKVHNEKPPSRDCHCEEHSDKAPPPVTPPKPTHDWESIAKYKAAELDNYIRRQKDAVQNAYNEGRSRVIMEIVPILDSIYEAVRTVLNPSDRQGIEMLQRKFEAVLVHLGMEEIPVKVGDPFDPHIHNCAMADPNTQNKIVEVWQKGYRYAGRVVRPATVKI